MSEVLELPKSVTIFGLKKDDKFFYVGKSIKDSSENELHKSDVKYQYHKPKLREIIRNNIEIIPLKMVSPNEWYDSKINEVHSLHLNNHPLINAEWMREGRRGYWEGKTRDKHTLSRLSESKHKRIAQYDLNGNLVEIWNSGKDIAISIFKDYRVINGGGNTKLYTLLRNSFKNRKYNNYYWIREEDLIKDYNTIPKFLDINAILLEDKNKKRANRKKSIGCRKSGGMTTTYTVIECTSDNKTIRTYNDVHEAAEKLGVSYRVIRRYCNGDTKMKNGNIMFYGKKTKSKIC